jgi:starch synthase
MRVLYVSGEVVPFAKTGGLADVAGALPKALSEIGHEVSVIMPKYRQVNEQKYSLKKVFSNLPVKMLDHTEFADIYEAPLPGSKAKAFFIGNAKYFDREGLYQDKGVDYPDNCERFSFFSKAVIEFVSRTGFQYDIIHANDWQSAMVIAYAKKMLNLQKIATVYSVHNMAYHGTFPKDQIFLTGFGWEMFTPATLEFYGNLAFSKAGFVFSDVINTVSPTYAKEIQTPEFGAGMDGLLRERSKDLFGILNGIDYSVWDPESDKQIHTNYDSENLAGKYDNKNVLQGKNLIPRKKNIPIIGMITRLADQKGFDILAGALDRILKLNCQLVILGTGEPKYHKLLEDLKEKYPEHIGLNLGFDAALAQLIYAGSDMFLMPSQYEPCGLGQLISFKYGTVPIVRKTGGLADTVHGFVFEEYSSEALLSAVTRALETYKNKKAWKNLVQKGMKLDYSWTSSAKKYIELYKEALQRIGMRKTPKKPVKAGVMESISQPQA